ncbi:MAG: (Fe-S)-binding protein [Gammaproteobacteria bacterium]
MNAPQLFADTDLCVKCGLCVSHCPTYRKTLDENESPRGRISLIQGWSTGELEATPALRRHLDNCLLCKTCENVCPARVPYSKLVNEFRRTVGPGEQSLAVKTLATLSRTVLPNKRLNAIAAGVATGIHSSGILSALAKGFPAAQGLQSLINDVTFVARRAKHYPTRLPRRGCVGLFVGCTGDLFDSATIDAAIRVLNAIGWDVAVPPEQNCCGALHLHCGDAERAGNLAASNLRAFGVSDLDAIITLATGCGAMLKEYPAYFPNSEAFAEKVVDISQFAARSPGFPGIGLAALDAELLLHTPCSLANVLKTPKAPQKLLEAIPGVRIATLDPSLRCCGAAGNYMLEHPDMAKALRQDMLDIVAQKKPDYLLTSNVGCALHLRSGLREHGIRTEVLHPIVLLGRQIEATEVS